ncbi:rhomboid-related protein 2-like [Rhipicephalus microplus]|uniref:rhomboid-related protein 2-like n=1 Tax=Rhipicephalus microplus TaxID=6941 RepID=UPI003F6BD7E1
MRHTGDYQELVNLLMSVPAATTTRFRVSDLRRVLGCCPTGDLLKEYVESSEAEGRNSLSLRECRDAYRSGKYLESRPWMLHVLRFSTVLVVGRRRRQDAILKRVASLSVDTEAAGCIDRSIRVNMCSTTCGFVTHFPFFILIVSLVQVATFVYHCAVPSCSESTQDRQLCQLPCNTSLIFNPRKRRELWRFLTYSLVHDGFLHLGSNVFLQIAFAFPLEVVHSWWPIMLVYVSGLLCGPLAQSLLNPDAFIAGSSSGVYSLQTAHLAHVLSNIRDMELAGLRIAMLLLVYLNDLYSIVRGPQNRHGQLLSYAGHYGGALAGLVVGLPVLNSAQRKRSPL